MSGSYCVILSSITVWYLEFSICNYKCAYGEGEHDDKLKNTFEHSQLCANRFIMHQFSQLHNDLFFR